MTIYALSSGSGISGIAVIRVSGKKASIVVKQIIKEKLPNAREATLLKFFDSKSKDLIDEGMLLWFPGPGSYTGEDLAEFHVHGSRAVINAMQSSIAKIEDCRLAEPGEFTKMAFENGKINLLKAESIADLVSAETELQRKQALKVMTGNSEKKFNFWREKLLKALSNIEANIDFPDENLPVSISNEIKKNVEEVLSGIKNAIQDQKIGEKIREGFKIAILGPTNAGKSSLLNYLSKRDVAIVSEIAGTTRDVIETHLNLDGYPVIISDTAGIREARGEIEIRGIKLALAKAENADLKLVIIDCKTKKIERKISKLIDKNTILILNKSDLLKKQKLNGQIKKYDNVLISIKKNKNVNKLIKKIKNRLKEKFSKQEDVLITRARHRDNLQECKKHLEKFIAKQNHKDIEKPAEDLRLATRYLGKIVGKVEVEEILDSIFNDFCIGK